MSCSCVYVDFGNDGDMVDIPPTEQNRVARKSHTCSECGKPIQIGEEYEYTTGKWDGRFLAFKTCSICREIREAFFCNGWYYTQILDDLRDHICDCDGEISSDCLSELSKPARDIVCDMIDEVWEED